MNQKLLVKWLSIIRNKLKQTLHSGRGSVQICFIFLKEMKEMWNIYNCVQLDKMFSIICYGIMFILFSTLTNFLHRFLYILLTFIHHTSGTANDAVMCIWIIIWYCEWTVMGVLVRWWATTSLQDRSICVYYVPPLMYSDFSFYLALVCISTPSLCGLALQGKYSM